MIRFASIVFLAASACSAESFAPEATDAALETGPTVKIAVPQDNSFVSLRPVRLDEEGEVAWMGSVLASAYVEDGYAAIQLPTRSGEFDRDTSKPNKPVTYVAFVQSTDLEGVAEAYTGIGTEVVQYWNGRSSSKRKGWFVMRDSEGKPAYASTDRIIAVDSTIAPAASVVIEGRKGQVGESPVLLGFTSPEGVVESWVGEVSETFSYRVEGDAPYLYVEDDGSHFIDLVPEAFVDSDSDGVWGSQDPVAGDVCWGEKRVFVSWASPAMSPQDAYAYHRGGLVTGWHAFAMAAEGAEMVPEGANLAMHTDCAAGMTTAEEGGQAEPDSAANEVDGVVGA